jgi:hypothetical protein
MADIQVNLLHKEIGNYKVTISPKMCGRKFRKSQKYGANVCRFHQDLALVAEVYGPNYKGQIKVAKQVKIFCIKQMVL